MENLIISIFRGFNSPIDVIIEFFKQDLNFKQDQNIELIKFLLDHGKIELLNQFSKDFTIPLEDLIIKYKVSLSLLRNDVTCSISPKTKNERYKIYFNIGLIQFLFDMLRLFSLNFKIDFEKRSNFWKRIDSINSIKSILNDIIKKFWKKCYIKQELSPDISLNNEEAQFLIISFFYELLFALAHEISHKVLGNKKFKKHINGKERLCDNYLGNYENYSENYKQKLKINWLKELDCDDFAFHTIINMEGKNKGYRQLVLASILNYFLFQYLCDVSQENQYSHIDLRKWETHPPNIIRLHNFIGELDNNLKEEYIRGLKKLEIEMKAIFKKIM